MSNIVLPKISWSIYVASNTVSLLLKSFNILERLWFWDILFLRFTTELTYLYLNGYFFPCFLCKYRKHLVKYARIQLNQYWSFFKALSNNCHPFSTLVHIDDSCHMIFFLIHQNIVDLEILVYHILRIFDMDKFI